MMDGRDTDDLERRLAGRLRPRRLPGADETWHRLAPQLAERPQRRTLLPMPLGVVRVARVVALFALVLFLTQAVRRPVSPLAVAPTRTGMMPGTGIAGASPATLAGWRPVPLSPRAGTPRVITVTDDPEERERSCGPWDTTASPQVRYASAVCIAVLVAENGQRSLANQIVSYGHWDEALTVFGLADIPGPPADRLVAIVRIGRLNGDAYVVILDAATGVPYLIVWPD